MKRFFVNLGFILFCFILFISSVVISFGITSAIIAGNAYAAWQVDWSDEVGTIYKNIDYNAREQTGYDLYIPKGLDKGKDQSLIVYMHGGGFTQGDKADGEMFCKYFTSKGYICASVNYSLIGDNRQSDYNRMYSQILTQVASIKRRTADLGYNVTGMATSGDSAGGYLALLYAYRAKEASPIPVKMVFQMTGPVTFEPSEWNITETKDIAESISKLSGKTVTEEMILGGEADEIIREISPALLVDNNTVPTVIAYGKNDKVVPSNLKYSLINELNKNDIDYAYIEFPNSGHSMAGDPDKTEEYLNTVNKYLKKYMSTN